MTGRKVLRTIVLVAVMVLALGSTTINRGCQDLSHFYPFIIWHCYYA
ncbi:MAG: hypothetical protein SFH39_11380 [Candidatus Magnetobacterium sp. LHC-1]